MPCWPTPSGRIEPSAVPGRRLHLVRLPRAREPGTARPATYRLCRHGLWRGRVDFSRASLAYGLHHKPTVAARHAPATRRAGFQPGGSQPLRPVQSLHNGPAAGRLFARDASLVPVSQQARLRRAGPRVQSRPATFPADRGGSGDAACRTSGAPWPALAAPAALISRLLKIFTLLRLMILGGRISARMEAPHGHPHR